jgi:hypothetical protein
MTINRYSFYIYDLSYTPTVEAEECADGDYVLYEDYQKEISNLKEQILNLKEQV